MRAQNKYHFEVATDPVLFDVPPDGESDDLAVRLAVYKQDSTREQDSLKLEIEAANAAFGEYGFSFFDLASCSPKAGKTKTSCAKAVGYLLQSPALITEMRTVHRLPMQFLEKNIKIPRKILERHRKYIIAAVEILSGEYPFLAEYMRTIREEIGK
jgi:RNA polymerase sigma factor